MESAAVHGGAIVWRMVQLLSLSTAATAMHVAAPGRVALETGGELTLVRNESEPPFAAPGVRPALCVVCRTAGEGYTLQKPGYVLGRKGPGAGPFMKRFRLEGEEQNGTLVVLNSTTARCTVPAVWTAGMTTVYVTMDGTGDDAGNWTPAIFEFFALANPAWGRRPYVYETEGSVVVATDRSLFGRTLRLSASLAPGVSISAQIPGGRELLVPFSLSKLPPHFDSKVNITVSGLPAAAGGSVTHMRRLVRVPPPEASGSSAATVFQVDHETGGMLAAGVPYIATGW